MFLAPRLCYYSVYMHQGMQEALQLGSCLEEEDLGSW